MLPAIISFIVCAGIPAAAAIYFLRRGDGTFLTFITGVLCFYISQPIIRVPLLRLLMQKSSTFALLPYTNILLYYLFAGFTAGLFEESARFIGLKIFRKGHTSWMDGMAFGLGHGGCEAAWLFFTQVLPLVSRQAPESVRQPYHNPPDGGLQRPHWHDTGQKPWQSHSQCPLYRL